tara:strand:- start:35566 stop:36252 length:687 start_codon:yes stop_codon:yes gene_type:complete
MKKIKYWVFDLDNTLYPAASNLFYKIDKRMKKFIMNKLKISEINAYKIQKKYYMQYGTTLFGLMKNHKINPEDFLNYVHDIDYSSLRKDTELNNELKKLPGSLYIYTNGSKTHAINVLKNLGVDLFLFKIFDIKDANYIPKPSEISLKIFIKKLKIIPSESIFFEDISINLKNPKKLGFKTVLIKSNSHPDTNNKIIKIKKEKNLEHIDFTSYHLTKFLNQINLDINE